MRYVIEVMGLTALLVGAFLSGALPFAYWLVRVTHGVDIRTVGSGNPGATNAARVFGKKRRLLAFFVIFSLDAGKGYLASAILPQFFDLEPWAPALAAAAAVLGHSFSPFLRFRGGKGVATTIGALMGLAPLATLAALGAFFVAYGAVRVVSLGSICFALALPAAVWLLDEADRSVFWLSMGLAFLIVIRHRSNIQRLLQGAES